MLPLFAYGEADVEDKVVAPTATDVPASTTGDAMLSVDARFDKTSDQLVDAADWKQMSEAERLRYAHASLEALGIDPYSKVSDEKTRVQQYLEGLNSVYK